MAAKKSAKKYGKKTEKTMKRVMHEEKHGTLKSGSTGRKVKSRKQAIAIGLSEARAAGAKVPKNPNAKKNKTATKRSRAKRTTKRAKKS